MSARTAMQWIITELRRKVNDYGVEPAMDSGIQYIGDTPRLKCDFYNMASVMVTPTSPRINIWNPLGSNIVASVTTLASTLTGRQYYDFAIPQVEGIYRVEFKGKIGTITSAYSTEFEARKQGRIWTDDELQNYLDKHRIFVGVDNARELLQRSADYKRYLSKFDT